MRIAITTTGPALDSPVDARFGRAKQFLFVDVETESFEICDNQQNLDAMQGAGIQAAQTLAAKGVRAVITGHCGPKAFRTLEAANIQVYVGASGTVREMLRKYRGGELRPADSADVEGHW